MIGSEEEGGREGKGEIVSRLIEIENEIEIDIHRCHVETVDGRVRLVENGRRASLVERTFERWNDSEGESVKGSMDSWIEHPSSIESSRSPRLIESSRSIESPPFVDRSMESMPFVQISLVDS